jgi:phosphoribosylaminoimidazole-succinocarboxamide synthase
MELTADIVPNWLIATQIPMLLWVICASFKVEMVIRYLSGHAAREYSGKRVICGVQMVEGLKEMINFQNQLLPYN